MSLKQIILDNRPRFNSDIFSYVKTPTNYDASILKGVLGEGFVSYWLSQVPGFDDFCSSSDLVYNEKYSCEDSGNGILVKRDSRAYCDLDVVCRISGINLGVEVKSNSLGNILHKLRRKVNVTSEISNDSNSRFGFFSPHSCNDICDICAIEDKFGDDVMCVDLGYKKSDLDKMCKEFKEYLGYCGFS